MLWIEATPSARSLDGEWFARHPEWWMLAISVEAWLVLAGAAQHAIPLPLCTTAAHDSIAVSFPALWAAQTWSRLAWDFLDLGLMAPAMMLPLVVLPVRHVAFRSFRDRRNRAIAEFLAGYLGIWIVAGTVLLPILIASKALSATERPLIATIAYSVAAAWQLTPYKRGALQRCHRMVPLAPEGWRANTDCIRFGLGSGASCLASCWALMAASILTSHGLAAMACIQVIMVRERYKRRPRPQTSASLLLLCAAFLLSRQGAII